MSSTSMQLHPYTYDVINEMFKESAGKSLANFNWLFLIKLIYWGKTSPEVRVEGDGQDVGPNAIDDVDMV